MKSPILKFLRIYMHYHFLNKYSPYKILLSFDVRPLHFATQETILKTRTEVIAIIKVCYFKRSLDWDSGQLGS